jgi:hypothetical protein
MFWGRCMCWLQMRLMHAWCEHHAAHAPSCVRNARILLLEMVLRVDQSLVGGWRLRPCP